MTILISIVFTGKATNANRALGEVFKTKKKAEVKKKNIWRN